MVRFPKEICACSLLRLRERIYWWPLYPQGALDAGWCLAQNHTATRPYADIQWPHSVVFQLSAWKIDYDITSCQHEVLWPSSGSVMQISVAPFSRFVSLHRHQPHLIIPFTFIAEIDYINKSFRAHFKEYLNPWMSTLMSICGSWIYMQVYTVSI